MGLAEPRFKLPDISMFPIDENTFPIKPHKITIYRCNLIAEFDTHAEIFVLSKRLNCYDDNGNVRRIIIDNDELSKLNIFSTISISCNNNANKYPSYGVVCQLDGSTKTISLNHVIIAPDNNSYVLHVNSDNLDFRKSNLEITSNINRRYTGRHTFNGVTLVDTLVGDGVYTNYRANITYRGTTRRKSFSIRKYGKDGAFKLATAFINKYKKIIAEETESEKVKLLYMVL